MREKCLLTTELSLLDKNTKKLSEKAHTTEQNKNDQEKIASFARKHHNLQDFHLKYSDKTIFNTKSSLIYVKQNLEVISPMLENLGHMPSIYKSQLSAVRDLWPYLQDFNISKKFNNLKNKNEMIDYKSISEFIGNFLFLFFYFFTFFYFRME
jgi:hypothetical protein